MKSLSDDARKAIQTAVQRWIDVDDISQSALGAKLGTGRMSPKSGAWHGVVRLESFGHDSRMTRGEWPCLRRYKP